MTQPFCCDITSGTKEEQNEFKRLFEKVSNDEWTFASEYYGFSKLYGWDGLTNSNDLVAIKYFTNILPLSEGILILKKMVGEEEKQERTYSLDKVREIALEYRNAFLYAHSHNLTRFELQTELEKIDEKHNLNYKEDVDSLQPKPTK